MKSDRILVGQPNLGDRSHFNRLIDEMFERRWFTNNGQIVQQLEQELCTYLRVRHCIPVCNATVGLQVACQAMELTGEVIVPAFTFAATPHAVAWCGLKPVFCDIAPESHLLDPDHAERLVTPDTRAILGVHVWGRACFPKQLQEIADRHGLALFFDAAHAFGCQHNGQMIGNFGKCEVFSFHATKFFNTFEGGAIATNDDELAARIRRMINFGFAGKDEVAHIGTNGKMSEIHAAMGLSCLRVIDDILATNKRHFHHYREQLSSVEGIRFCNFDDMEQSNYQYVVIEVDPQTAGLSRNQLMNHLHSEGIMARRYFYPGCHQIPAYSSKDPSLLHRLRQTDRLCQRTLALPTGTGVTEADVDRVTQSIRDAIAAPTPETLPQTK